MMLQCTSKVHNTTDNNVALHRLSVCAAESGESVRERGEGEREGGGRERGGRVRERGRVRGRERERGEGREGGRVNKNNNNEHISRAPFHVKLAQLR